MNTCSKLIAGAFAALLCSQAMAAPETLGRLFFEPQQRERLDQQRLRNPGFNANEAEGSLTFNGEVRASNGRRTRWINGSADWSGAVPAPRLPVGDTLDRATGERQPLLGNGRITVRPPTGQR